MSGYAPKVIGQSVLNGVLTLTFDDGSTKALDTGSAAAMQAATMAALKTPYQNSAATSGTVAMGSQIGILRLTGSPLLAALTVLLPPGPVDGQIARIFTASGISILTVQDASGAAVSGGALTGIGTLATTVWQFQNTAWQRVG